MALETTHWDIQDHIKTAERQLGYLEAALEDGDPVLVAAALGDIAKARGMSFVAQEAGVTRESPSKALGDPKLSTFMSAVKALGLRLRIEAV